MTEIDDLESKRLALQAQLDSEKTADDRNRMGQFATPTALAREILEYGVRLLPRNEPIRFLDPAIGTGSFYSALLAAAPSERIETAMGYEIDAHYCEPSRELWHEKPLEIQMQDFAHADTSGLGANLLICNPPYVRHHHMDAARKSDIQQRTEDACGVKINGLSGLYCYFMGLSHSFMSEGGVAGWLIPSEFMVVNYGRMLKRYLLEKVTLLHIHRYDPENVQFNDALVSSAVVWIKNTPPPTDHAVLFTYGGSLTDPAISRKVPVSELVHEPKWTRYPQADKATKKSDVTLGDLFDIKRGLATGDNKFFILDRSRIEELNLPMECFRPVLPGSRFVPEDEIKADKDGLPTIDRQLFLLDTRIPEDEIAVRYPSLKEYLDTGRKGEKPVSNRYLCRGRKPWYSQENRPPAPIICTYMGRSRKGARPFRFLLNHSQATACNTYLMLYPKPAMARAIAEDPSVLRTAWEFLNAIDPDELLGHGRVYGGGLHKLEPKELRGFPAESLLAMLPGLSGATTPRSQEVMSERNVA